MSALSVSFSVSAFVYTDAKHHACVCVFASVSVFSYAVHLSPEGHSGVRGQAWQTSRHHHRDSNRVITSYTQHC